MNNGYQNYLNSGGWKNTRNIRLHITADHKYRFNTTKDEVNCCQICGASNNLHIHHGKYFIDEKTAKLSNRKCGSILGQELPQELFVLCSSCHKLWHLNFKKKFPRLKIFRRITFLLNAGVVKDKAFWLAGQPELYACMHSRLFKK